MQNKITKQSLRSKYLLALLFVAVVFILAACSSSDTPITDTMDTNTNTNTNTNTGPTSDTGTSTSGAVSFTLITDDAPITVNAKYLTDGADISAADPFTCLEPGWGTGNQMCEGNPMFSLTRFGTTTTNANEVKLYKKVEIQVVVQKTQNYLATNNTNNTNTNYNLDRCDGVPNTNQRPTICTVALLGTTKAFTGDERDLVKSDSSIELISFAGNYGIEAGLTEAERTFTQEITSLWPYLQGEGIFLSINNFYAQDDAEALKLDAIRLVLTPYKTDGSDLPAAGTKLPYRVASAWGNDKNDGGKYNLHLNSSYFYANAHFGANMDGALLDATKFFDIPKTLITAEDIADLSKLDVIVYSVGRWQYEYLTYTQRIYLGKNKVLADATEIGTIEITSVGIESSDELPPSAVFLAGKVDPPDYQYDFETGKGYYDDYTQTPRAGWIPGHLVPQYVLPVEDALLESLALEVDMPLTVNLDIDTASRGKLSFISNGYFALSSHVIFYTDYVPNIP